MGEVVVPLPIKSGAYQYHLPLQPNPSKMAKPRTPIHGHISFQLRLRDFAELPGYETLLVQPSVLKACAGTVAIEVVKAVGLKTADLVTSDPYCVGFICTGPKTVRSWKTTTVYRTTNPEWYETSEFPINFPVDKMEPPPTVKIEVWDWDQFSSHDYLGEVMLPLPVTDGEQTFEVELQPNFTKGSNLVKGVLHVRMRFRNLFAGLAEKEELRPYDHALCEYFGSRPVDERLAREVVPNLVFFHLSKWRLFFAQFDFAWRYAILDPHVRAGGADAASRVQRFLVVISSLWACAVLTAAGIFFSPSDLGFGFALGLGAVLGAVVPNVSHILAQFLWHSAPHPESKRSSGDPCVFGVLVLFLCWGCLLILVSFAEVEEAAQMGVGAGMVVLSRLMFVPFLHGFVLTIVVVCAKRSAMFDRLLWYFPSLLTTHGVLTSSWSTSET